MSEPSERKREKKRKHNSDDAERSHKKRALEAPPATVRVSLLQDVGDLAPAIVTSPGINLPSKILFKAYTKARKEAGASKTGGSAVSKTELLLHSSAHPNLDYVGQEEEQGGADSLLKHYVGIYDPKTGELQVVEACELVVRGVAVSAATQTEPNGTVKQETNLSARTLLGQAFGTKKSQKAIQSLTDNAIASSAGNKKGVLDAVASAVMNSMAESSATIPTKEELQAAVDNAKPRPKPNLEAETPADVYPAENLVGMDVLEGLAVKTWQDAVEANRDVKTSSRFVSRRLIRVVRTDDVKKLRTLKALLLMLNWYGCLQPGGKNAKKLPKREDVKKAVGPEVPDRIVDSIRKRFATDTTLNKWAIDKIITHICALALAIDNCEVDMHDLREDLKLDNKEITQYFRELGCKTNPPTEAERLKMKVSKAEAVSHKLAKLKLPLDLPKARVAVASKRR